MIELKNVSYRQGASRILEDVSFTLNRGDFTAILGPNGAGKSTLLNIMLGQLEPSEGAVFCEGQAIRDWLKDQHFGYLPQRETIPPLFPGSAFEIVRLGLIARWGAFKRLPKTSSQEIMEALELTGAGHLAKRPVAELSGGEFQRVLLARALVGGSQYLFLDEPEAGVDSQQVASFYSLLTRLNQEGRTILLVSHDINVILKTVTSVICLNRTLHCHTRSELVSSEVIRKTWGDVLQLVDKPF